MAEILLGSHVGMSGKEMFLGSVKEAAEDGANALMVYTGAPQNTRRKEIGELRLDEGLFRIIVQPYTFQQRFCLLVFFQSGCFLLRSSTRRQRNSQHYYRKTFVHGYSLYFFIYRPMQ